MPAQHLCSHYQVRCLEALPLYHFGIAKAAESHCGRARPLQVQPCKHQRIAVTTCKVTCRFVEVWRASKILAPEVLDAYMSHTVHHKDRPAFFRYNRRSCLHSQGWHTLARMCTAAVLRGLNHCQNMLILALYVINRQSCAATPGGEGEGG